MFLLVNLVLARGITEKNTRFGIKKPLDFCVRSFNTSYKKMLLIQVVILLMVQKSGSMYKTQRK